MMQIHFLYEPDERETNIGIAKALSETNLKINDLSEIAHHLLVICNHHPFGKEEQHGIKEQNH